MRFTEFLKTAVLLFAASATVLAAVTIVGASSKGDNSLIYFSLGWWGAATITGIFVGRRMKVTDGIRRLLADARSTPILPEVEPGRVIFNRLWLLAVLTIGAGALAFLVPQVPPWRPATGSSARSAGAARARPSWRSSSATAFSSTSSPRRRSARRS